jgi:lambda family phage portal protein
VISRGNMIDRVVSYFSPVEGARRLRARTLMAVMGGYNAGSTSRRTMSGWKTISNSADADTLPDTPKLRERSRDLMRNSPLACGALNTSVVSVIGGTGLVNQSRLDADVLGLSDAEVEAWQRNVDREFRLWTGSQECDLERTLRFAEIQELVYRQTFENGDVFVSMPFVKRPGSPYGLKLQIIEADRVSNPRGERERTGFAGGIEKDANGAPEFIHIQKGHPGGLTRAPAEWDKVRVFGARTGRRNLLHLYRKLRPGQSRGVPDLAPVMESLKQLERYTEAELMAAVVSGMFTVFVKTSTGEGDFAPFEPTVESGAKTTDADLKLANGAVVSLAEGEDIVTADPKRPNANYDPFVMAVLKHIGAALGMPYEILTKHFSSSYSASRAAMLEAWRFFMARRVWMARNFCQPVYEAWLMEAVASGRIAAPGFLNGDLRIRQAYCGCDWVGPAKGMIDEKKEIEASEKKVAMGLSTLQKEAAELTGTNWETNHEQRRKEIARRQQDGLDATPSPPADDASARMDELEDKADEAT